ncbi:MAG: sigma-70 family polymerase sigma factor [Solirubrobacterales bacterium]|nr:sigma-70 family polymerase sigma factor [Solirubrobacterales bacterium]
MAAPASLASTWATSGDTTDVELVAAVRRGDDRAFERLYERYHRRIAAYVYGMVNDHGRAEDLAQDVFISALRRMRETDGPIAFKPWVYEIAKNACIDQFRRARRTQEVSFDAEDGLGAADQGRLANAGPTPDAAVDQKMSLDHLCGAFGQLSDTHHQILVMRELEGLSYREIGERLDLSRPSVESTLFRARRRLTEEYAELISGERCLRVQAIIVGAAGASPGSRDQRRMAAHVSHCQPCRRAAHVAGVGVAVAPGRAARVKIAAVLPMPEFLRRRVGGGRDLGDAAGSGPASTLATWSAQAGASMDPAFVSWAKAAAAAATIAVTGVGAGDRSEPLAGRTDGARPVITARAHAAPAPAAARPVAVSVTTTRPTPVAVASAVGVPPATRAIPAAGPSRATAAAPAATTAKPVSPAGELAAAAGGGPAAASAPIGSPLPGTRMPATTTGQLPVIVDLPAMAPVTASTKEAGAVATGAVESVAGIVGGR